MGCDWVMRVWFLTTYSDGTTDHLYDESNEGVRSIYLSHNDDSECYRQMAEWKKICPNTTLYEKKGSWLCEDDILYSTTEWCKTSIKYTKSRIIELVEDLTDIIKIEAIPYAYKRD